MFGLCIDTVSTKEDKGGTGGFDRDEEHPMKNLEQLKLTKKQQALVDTLLSEGGSIAAAAVKAGYAEGNSGKVTAYKTLKLPHVQQYMAQATQQRLGLNALIAVHKVAKLAEGAKSEYVQLQAAQDILDRAGYKPIDRAQVQIAGDIRVNIDLG